MHNLVIYVNVVGRVPQRGTSVARESSACSTDTVEFFRAMSARSESGKQCYTCKVSSVGVHPKEIDDE